MKELIDDVIEFLIDRENDIKNAIDEIVYQQGSPLNERIKPLTVGEVKELEKKRKEFQACEDLITYFELNWNED
jgi:hypothetical protein